MAMLNGYQSAGGIDQSDPYSDTFKVPMDDLLPIIIICLITTVVERGQMS